MARGKSSGRWSDGRDERKRQHRLEKQKAKSVGNEYESYEVKK